jgi:hypothetical protein
MQYDPGEGGELCWQKSWVTVLTKQLNMNAPLLIVVANFALSRAGHQPQPGVALSFVG